MVFQDGASYVRTFPAVLTSLWFAGCAGAPVVPPGLQENIDRDVSFQQLRASPLSYKGKMIVVGGTVLSVKPIKQDGTRIEILHLPLERDYEPRGRLTESGGRFLALHKEFVDPATIPVGTRMTVVGEVTGSMNLMLDEIDYAYPTLDVVSLTIWPPKLPAYWFRPYPYFGAYWGPYWGPYWGIPW